MKGETGSEILAQNILLLFAVTRGIREVRAKKKLKMLFLITREIFVRNKRCTEMLPITLP